MKVDLCQSCGSAFDADEINDGFCLMCQPEPIDSGITNFGKFINSKLEILEEPPKVDWNALGDCE
jgi:hypothetical protein